MSSDKSSGVPTPVTPQNIPALPPAKNPSPVAKNLEGQDLPVTDTSKEAKTPVETSKGQTTQDKADASKTPTKAKVTPSSATTTNAKDANPVKKTPAQINADVQELLKQIQARHAAQNAKIEQDHVQATQALAVNGGSATPLPAPVKAQSVELPEPKDLEDVLEQTLPELQDDVVAIVTGEFHWQELIDLGEDTYNGVRKALPYLHGQDVNVIVDEIVRYAWNKYAVPVLPDGVKLFENILESALVFGVDTAFKIAHKHGDTSAVTKK